MPMLGLSFIKKKREQFKANKLRKKLSSNIEKQIQFSLPYFLLLVLSTIISTLGLIADNPPVVIGSMLISPLIWSVFGLSLGLVTLDLKIFGQALKSFITAFLIVILVSAVVSKISGISVLTSQIKMRLAPNLVDLLIGLVAGAAGIVALYYPKASSPLYMTGISIALSLLPSLAVVGIGLSNFDWQVAFLSLILFLTNVIGVVIASSFVLLLLKFQTIKT